MIKNVTERIGQLYQGWKPGNRWKGFILFQEVISQLVPLTIVLWTGGKDGYVNKGKKYCTELRECESCGFV